MNIWNTRERNSETLWKFRVFEEGMFKNLQVISSFIEGQKPAWFFKVGSILNIINKTFGLLLQKTVLFQTKYSMVVYPSAFHPRNGNIFSNLDSSVKGCKMKLLENR